MRSRHLPGSKPFLPLGPAHDEWKLIPWGLPEHRTVPANAVMSNTVKLRIGNMPQYRPTNLIGQCADSYQQYKVISEDEL